MIKKLIKEKNKYWGDLSGISGDLTGIRGNIDECEITLKDRKKGIKIEDLIL